jgi:HAE1 family hydrophobic/amphiphilic exporter-1
MSLSELCVRRPVFATTLVVTLVVLGIFSFRDLGVDLFPKADPATVNVQIQLPGASPAEITTVVIEPLEDALSGVSGIDQMNARANEGVASITLRFVLERDLNDAANSVREKVAGAMRHLPPQVLPPVIQEADPDADPIMTIVLSSKTVSLRELTEIADKQVKRALESVNGVGDVSISGGRAREVHIVMDVDKLNAYGLTIDQVRDAVDKENVEIPGGILEQGKSQLGLRTLGRIDATHQFNNIIVTTVNGTPVRISDLGYAEDATERVGSTPWMDNGEPAVHLAIRPASGENTIKVSEAVKGRLKTVQQTLPRAVSLALTRDDSRFIYASIASLEEHLLWGSLLAALVVMFFIRNIRAVVISALAIPASIVATFTLMRVMDFTLNSMTLLGITLAQEELWDAAQAILRPSRPGDFNQAMMELGATVCFPREPQCQDCPIRKFCRTRGTGEPPTVRLRQQKKEITYSLNHRPTSVLLVRRSKNESLMPGMWELPEVITSNSDRKPLFLLRHSITVTNFVVRVVGSTDSTGQWIKISRLNALPLTGLAKKILQTAKIIQ